jgi:alkanesulfonate monooxygenase SsuD/methylene tetrahydromethanopterin reductase-like flavin-dependent oxidoreductase (luciferase family)
MFVLRHERRYERRESLVAMKYGLDMSTADSYSDPRRLADLAAEAEQAGWDGFFLWDAVFARPPDLPMADPWVALAAIAVKTRRIRIGAMVTPLARRRPWQVARETVSLDHLSNGRLVFGVGLGYQDLDFEAFGEETDPRIRGEKLDEGLAVLTGLWSGRRVTFQGKHYQVRNVKFLPKPVQTPRIPVWVAGYWPNHRPFRRAAQWDGVLPGKVNEEPLAPEELREIMAYVHAHRSRSGHFDVAVYGFTPPNPEKAARIVQPWIEAGATWWREGLGDWRGSLKTVQARIRSGPPMR